LAVIALILGPVALYQRKRSCRHKIIGLYMGYQRASGRTVALHDRQFWCDPAIRRDSPPCGPYRAAPFGHTQSLKAWADRCRPVQFPARTGRNPHIFLEKSQLGYVANGLGICALVINTVLQKRRLNKSVPKSRIFPLEKPATMV